MRCMRIEASAAVLSSTLRIFIWPRSYALRIDSIRLCEVLPKGSSVMLSVRLSIFSILALTFTAPPRRPSL